MTPTLRHGRRRAALVAIAVHGSMPMADLAEWLHCEPRQAHYAARALIARGLAAWDGQRLTATREGKAAARVTDAR